MKIFFISLACFFSLLHTCGQIGIPVPQLSQCDILVNNFLSTYSIPGGTLAIAKDGRIIYMKAFGNANVANNIATQPNNLFRLASISKTITAISIMKMMENGQLSLSSKVFGPGSILQNHPLFSTSNITDPRVFNITVQQLLEHSAGWNNSVNCNPNPSTPYPYFVAGCEPIRFPLRVTMLTGTTNPIQKDALVKFLLEKGLNLNPGVAYLYSNVGYFMLGKVIEQISGLSYETYVKNNILAPLGIFDMHIGKTLLSEKQEREGEYVGEGDSTLSCYGTGNYVPWEYGGSSVPALDATGGWIATPRDILKLMVAVDGFSTKPDILLPATIINMTTPSATNPNYAKGWDVNPANRWWHYGSYEGTASELVRTANGYTWAIILNKRNLTNPQFWTDLDNLPMNCITAASSFPAFDLMENPKINATNISFSNKSNTSVKVSWTNGSGNQRMLLARQDTIADEFPMDGIDYTANPVFGSGAVLGLNNFIVYNGTGDSVTVTGLIPGKKYYFRVIEFNKNTVTGNYSLYLLGGNPIQFTRTRYQYTFTGNGNWTDSTKWSNSTIPPSVLPAESDIIINPSGIGECVLNIPQVISTGSTLTVKENKRFRIQGNLTMQ